LLARIGERARAAKIAIRFIWVNLLFSGNFPLAYSMSAISRATTTTRSVNWDSSKERSGNDQLSRKDRLGAHGLDRGGIPHRGRRLEAARRGGRCGRQDVEKIRATIERYANTRTQAMETIRTALTAEVEEFKRQLGIR
jgi:hypothetical protein